ncbi:MAG: MerR family transcriptional regulator [Bacteroidales bacterium]
MKRGENSPKVYYTIGEVSRLLGVNPSTLRFWEKEFEGIKPYRNKKGNRFYHPKDVEMLKLIYYLLKDKRYTIEGAREYIRLNKKQGLRDMEIAATLKDIRAFLVHLRDSL